MASLAASQDYPPDRWPPKIVHPASATEFVATLDALLAQVDEAVSILSDDDLDKDVTFPWGQQQAGDALSAALTHALTHARTAHTRESGCFSLNEYPLPFSNTFNK